MLKRNLPNIKHWYNYFSLLTPGEHCGKKEMGVLIIKTPIPFAENFFA
jgi:hypothetical protein